MWLAYISGERKVTGLTLGDKCSISPLTLTSEPMEQLEMLPLVNQLPRLLGRLFLAEW